MRHRLALIVIIVIAAWFHPSPADTAVKKAGNLELVIDEPLFAPTVVWYPGVSVSRSFQVKNRDSSGRTIAIEASSKQETKKLSQALVVEIKRGEKIVFGSPTKTMKDFWDAGVVEVGTIQPGDTGEVFTLAVSLPLSAGNESQGARAAFDLTIGFPGDEAATIAVTTIANVGPIPAAATGLAGRQPGSSLSPTLAPTADTVAPGRVAGEQTTDENGRWNWRWLGMLLAALLAVGLSGWRISQHRRRV